MAGPADLLVLIEHAKRWPARPIRGHLGAGTERVTTRAGLLCGYSINPSAVGEVTLYNGQDALGQIIFDVAIPGAGEAFPIVSLPDGGLLFDNGLFQVNAAALTSCVWYVRLFED
jgi:hypothetical protein